MNIKYKYVKTGVEVEIVDANRKHLELAVGRYLTREIGSLEVTYDEKKDDEKLIEWWRNTFEWLGS